MARRRTVGEILGKFWATQLQRGNFGGHKGSYLETRVANILQTFHTAVWPGDGQSVKFWANSGQPSSRYPCKHRKPYPEGQFWGSQRPISRVADFLQTFHTAVWPGDGQWVKFLSVKLWATQLEMSLQPQGTLSKGAILGVTKAHISRLEWPTCFKLFTQLYDQGSITYYVIDILAIFTPSVINCNQDTPSLLTEKITLSWPDPPSPPPPLLLTFFPKKHFST